MLIENVSGHRHPSRVLSNKERLANWEGPYSVARTLENYPRPVGTYKPAANVSKQGVRHGV